VAVRWGRDVFLDHFQFEPRFLLALHGRGEEQQRRSEVPRATNSPQLIGNLKLY